jgi:hypothetical protein
MGAACGVALGYLMHSCMLAGMARLSAMMPVGHVGLLNAATTLIP